MKTTVTVYLQHTLEKMHNIFAVTSIGESKI